MFATGTASVTSTHSAARFHTKPIYEHEEKALPMLNTKALQEYSYNWDNVTVARHAHNVTKEVNSTLKRHKAADYNELGLIKLEDDTPDTRLLNDTSQRSLSYLRDFRQPKIKIDHSILNISTVNI